MRNMKKKLLALLLIVSIMCSCLIFTACNNDQEKPEDPEIPNNPVEDDDYTISVLGIDDSEDGIKITKGQIKELYKNLPVVFDEENPVYASDKQDDNGDLIPHTLKGVYLEDILYYYANKADLNSFESMELKALDGCSTVLGVQDFNYKKGGVKPIVCFEYDGHQINKDTRSGSLRFVFPNKPANSWTRQLSIINFKVNTEKPSPSKINFVEMLNEDYNGQFEKKGKTYFGISFKKLIEAGILNADGEKEMFIEAWDATAEEKDKIYEKFTTYEYYNDSYLVYFEQEEGGEKVAREKAPCYDGVKNLRGMTIKDVLYAAVNDTALVALDTAFVRFGDEFTFDKILTLAQMENKKAEYIITDVADKETVVSHEDLAKATVKLTDGKYQLTINDTVIEIKSLAIKEKELEPCEFSIDIINGEETLTLTQDDVKDLELKATERTKNEKTTFYKGYTVSDILKVMDIDKTNIESITFVPSDDPKFSGTLESANFDTAIFALFESDSATGEFTFVDAPRLLDDSIKTVKYVAKMEINYKS